MPSSITQPQYNSLVSHIYSNLMVASSRYEYDDEGRETKIELGMAEMGEARDLAADIVLEWANEHNITITE